MYAIIKTGGKQYKVQEGDVIDVERLDHEEGTPITFNEVLFLMDGKKTHVGTPTVEGWMVTGEHVADSVGEKIDTLKYKKRCNQYRRWGHRQHYNKIKITKIAKGKKGE